MKHIKKFNNTADYNNAEIIFPNVSLNTSNGNNIKYMTSFKDTSFESPYKNQYFTIECIKAGKIMFGPGWGTDLYKIQERGNDLIDPYQLFLNGTLYIKYSKNNGASWINITDHNNDFFHMTVNPQEPGVDPYDVNDNNGPLSYEFNMKAGEKILISAKIISGNCMCDYTPEDDPYKCLIDTVINDDDYGEPYDPDMYGSFKVYGNLRSLFLGDDFLTSYTNGNSFGFGGNVYNYNSKEWEYRSFSFGRFFLGKSIVDAENLICDFPADYDRFVMGIEKRSIIEKGPTFIIDDVNKYSLRESIFVDINALPNLQSFKVIGDLNSYALYTIFKSYYWDEEFEGQITLYVSPNSTCETTVNINGQTKRTVPEYCTIQKLS